MFMALFNLGLAAWLSTTTIMDWSEDSWAMRLVGITLATLNALAGIVGLLVAVA